MKERITWISTSKWDTKTIWFRHTLDMEHQTLQKWILSKPSRDEIHGLSSRYKNISANLACLIKELKKPNSSNNLLSNHQKTLQSLSQWILQSPKQKFLRLYKSKTHSLPRSGKASYKCYYLNSKRWTMIHLMQSSMVSIEKRTTSTKTSSIRSISIVDLVTVNSNGWLRMLVKKLRKSRNKLRNKLQFKGDTPCACFRGKQARSHQEYKLQRKKKSILYKENQLWKRNNLCSKCKNRPNNYSPLKSSQR